MPDLLNTLGADSMLKLSELCDLYLAHCRVYYRKPSGRPTREANNVADAMRPLLEIAANLPAIELSPKLLRELQQHQITTSTVARTTINARINRVRRMARWAAEMEYLPADLPHKLAIVSPLKRGRTLAPESPGVCCVPWADVEATILALFDEATKQTVPAYKLSRIRLATLIEFHWWTGCRPGEACRASKSTIDTSGDVWVFRPDEHKSEHHGHPRVIAIGPKGQDALRPWWDRCTTDWLFCGRSGGPLSENGYGQAVRRVNERNKLRGWNPGQIRHSAGTRLRREAGGLDPVRAQLGHRRTSTTEIYADLDLAKATDLMRRFG